MAQVARLAQKDFRHQLGTTQSEYDLLKHRQVPSDFVCPYQSACPHMDGISAQWAYRVFMEQWGMKDHVRKLENDNDELQVENTAIKIERDQFKAQFQALHRKQFKSGKAKQSKPAPENEKKKKRGPPEGHPPWTRSIPDHIDKVVTVPAPTICPHCEGHDLSPSSEKVEQIQEDIIIQPRTFVTCFKHDTAFCPSCRRPVWSTAPGELRNCSIGPTAKAAAVWLHHDLNMPFREVKRLLCTFFGMNFVPASALNFTLSAAGKSQPLYEDLREKIRASGLLYLDETSWRLDGFSAWLWYAGNSNLDFFHIDRSRSADVIADILGDEFGGDIVSDDYAAYNILLARWRQTCLAHIIRSAKEIAAEIGLIKDSKDYAQDIRFASIIAEFFSDVCALDKQRRLGKLSRKKARSMVPSLRKRLKNICGCVLSHPKTINLCDKLLSAKRLAKKLFTFLTRPGMSPTNNHAERALRKPVIARKISFGSRSDSGAHAFAVIASMLGTARRQNKSPLDFLHTLFTASTEESRSALYANSS